MAEQEYRGFLTNIQADGEREILLPITDKACVRGMEEVDAHVVSRENPHGVTAAQIGAEKAGAISAHEASPDAHREQFDAKADKRVSKEVASALGLDPQTATVNDALFEAGKHIILHIVFTGEYVGQSYRITGPGISDAVTGTVPPSKSLTFTVLVLSSRYQLTCKDRTIDLDVGDYYGVYKFILAPPLAQATPATIREVTESGMAKAAWCVGDEINMTLSDGEAITLQIYDFDHDTLASGGPAPITFGMKHCMRELKKMGESRTNLNGWPGTSLYTYLNTRVYGRIPQEWKTIMKSVKKLTSEGSQSEAIRGSNDKLFLFCEEEVSGGISNAVAGEGKQYPIFTDNASRVKRGNNGLGNASPWWMRSPHANTDTSFCYVREEGVVSNATAIYMAGVSFGFCV